MKVVVTQRFQDKHNGKVYKVDDVITVSKKRYEEILETGEFVKPIEEEKEVKEVTA